MTRKEIQELLDKPDRTAEEMLQIGEAYIRGDVLRDMTAAEGWLEKAVEQEIMPASALAMSLLATKIYGAEFAVSEAEFAMLQEAVKQKNDLELEILLQIAKKERKKIDNRKKRCEYNGKAVQ